jgi:hypothetical protein
LQFFSTSSNQKRSQQTHFSNFFSSQQQQQTISVSSIQQKSWFVAMKRRCTNWFAVISFGGGRR